MSREKGNGATKGHLGSEAVARVVAVLILLAGVIVPHGVLHQEGPAVLMTFSIFFLMGLGLLYLAS